MVSANFLYRLDMISPFYPLRDLRLSGHVIYTGRSSMEIAVKMEALEKNGSEHMIMLGELHFSCFLISHLILTFQDDFRWFAETP